MPRPKGEAEPQQLRCADCFQESQFRRHLHFLQFRNATDLTEHLNAQYPKNAKGEYQDRWAKDSGIDGVIRWYVSTRRLYSSYVDPQGLPLPAWRAWKEAQVEAAKDKGRLRADPQRSLGPEDQRTELIRLAEKFNFSPERLLALLSAVEDVPF